MLEIGVRNMLYIIVQPGIHFHSNRGSVELPKQYTICTLDNIRYQYEIMLHAFMPEDDSDPCAPINHWHKAIDQAGIIGYIHSTQLIECRKILHA